MVDKFLNLASVASVWRGLDIYRDGRVLSCEELGNRAFRGEVQGTADEPYKVQISLDHPRSSKCDCPHAKDRYVVCKHKVALFFEAVPNSEADFLRAVEEERIEYEREEQRLQDDRHREICEFVMALSKGELQRELISALEELDYWQDRYWR